MSTRLITVKGNKAEKEVDRLARLGKDRTGQKIGMKLAGWVETGEARKGKGTNGKKHGRLGRKSRKEHPPEQKEKGHFECRDLKVHITYLDSRF